MIPNPGTHPAPPPPSPKLSLPPPPPSLSPPPHRSPARSRRTPIFPDESPFLSSPPAEEEPVSPILNHRIPWNRSWGTVTGHRRLGARRCRGFRGDSSGSARRAADLEFFLEDPENFDTLSVIFNRSSRFAKLQDIKCAIAEKNLYMRLTCSTGDAMRMNMVSKGVQNALDFLQSDFPDMDVIGIS
ncbi:hypothetical protein Droror1_Dr00027520, partial [Drosera rotundifolia]